MLAYELLYGRGPFDARDMKQLLTNIKNKEVVFPPNELYPRRPVSEDMKDFIRGVLKKNVEERYAPKEMKDHPVFKKVDFERLLERNVKKYPLKRKHPLPPGEMDKDKEDLRMTRIGPEERLLGRQLKVKIDKR